MRSRIAVLASGGGTNLQSILDHFARQGDARSADVVLVASNRTAAGALDRARSRDIPTVVISTSATDDVKETSLDDALREHDVDLIALAGYLRLVPIEVVRRYEGRILNTHPALLPAFGGTGMYGRRVHQAVLDAGAKISGVSVHFVDEVYDRGRIIAQWPVPVFGGDDAATLAARVLRIEHLLYPRVLDAVAAGRISAASLDDSGPIVATDAAFTLVSREDACLAKEIESALGC